MNDVKNYRDLLVWQKAMDLIVEVYQITYLFPKQEIYGLTSQITRAVISVASNIAEGSSRRSTTEYLRFINIARSSLAEAETQITISLRIGFIQQTKHDEVLGKMGEINKMLQGLYNSLNTKA